MKKQNRIEKNKWNHQKNRLGRVVGNLLDKLRKKIHEWNGYLEIFSLPQALANSRQFLLLRTDISKKTVVGRSWIDTSSPFQNPAPSFIKEAFLTNTTYITGTFSYFIFVLFNAKIYTPICLFSFLLVTKCFFLRGSISQYSNELLIPAFPRNLFPFTAFNFAWA